MRRLRERWTTIAPPLALLVLAAVWGREAGPVLVIGLPVLTPETLAAARNARRGRTQTSLNLALGSSMASVGLTIPTLAVASIWLPTRLELGLGPTHLVLLAMTALVGVLTIVPGRATRLQGGLHLVLFAAYLLLSIDP